MIFCAYAAIGIQLIEPFYSHTIREDATHSSLQVFYKELYESLSTKKVGADFLSFESPAFPGVSAELLTGVKEGYGAAVVESVKDVTQEYEEDIILLINIMLPELDITLAKQRRDYSLDPDIFPPQYPIADQASNIDDTPANNMDME